VTYFLSPFAYLAAALAIPLGVMARGDERSRLPGTAAVVLACVAIIWSTVGIVLYEW
jgi:hypothetical protein